MGLAHVHKHRAAVVPSQLGHGQAYLAYCNGVARKKGPEDISAQSPSATLVPVPARFRVSRSRRQPKRIVQKQSDTQAAERKKGR